ncbi:DUF6985 domain-containing protein [Actinospica robiniae]|uniref:DUF6985 domain-containing protein n=1 Tax=Actinospica robiniae TaxID=304901 RepID=UPI0004177F11|nr:hypothetical protein [Actinospica robiniae]
MEIPGLGRLTLDPKYEWYQSRPIPVPVLGGGEHTFTVEGYGDDPSPLQVHDAVSAFLGLDESVLKSSAQSIFEYYLDVQSDVGDEEGFPSISTPDEVWQHIVFGELSVGRDGAAVYVSVESECSWEPEHGLQIVFRDGRAVTKVGPFDGQYINAAPGGRELEGVVYHRWGLESCAVRACDER